MTSHGVKVAARNLAEMKSKEAYRRAAAAKEAVMEADCELTRQWKQLQATADLVREASETASAEARFWSDKLFYAEEELDESRRLSEEETRSTAVVGVVWKYTPRTWLAGRDLKLTQADIMTWCAVTDDVSQQRKLRVYARNDIVSLSGAVSTVHMSPDEAKSFAATRSEIHGFTYNKRGSHGGTAYFKTTSMSDCKSVWSEETPPSNGKGLNKYEWHDHYEKTS
jgi:hypothetical protein